MYEATFALELICNKALEAALHSRPGPSPEIFMTGNGSS